MSSRLEERRESYRNSLHRISDNVGRSFWKGSDVIIRRDILIPPSVANARYGEWFNVPIVVTKENLPPLQGLYRSDLSHFKGSAKSRRAQSGIDLWENPGNYLAHEIARDCYNGRYAQCPINFHEGVGLEMLGSRPREWWYEIGYRELEDIFEQPFETQVPVANRSARPIKLEEGMGLFRFFCPLAPPLYGQQLRSLVGSEITIEGQEGVHWSLGDIEAVILVEPESEQWMPPSKDLLVIPDGVRNYRDLIDVNCEPLPDDLRQGMEEILCIGQTPRFCLSERVEAVLLKAAYPTLNGDFELEDLNSLHINSWLIDAGSDHGIRTETRMRYPRKKQYVSFLFYLNSPNCQS
ncbi:MAG: hypothetical protein US86_C0002G0083 [Candidatus Daviesbacteria bacterium GW2011_GWA2_38_24]|uniref:DUF2169 domain-containing protein n=1 Tax=Candidatus Daviesbacteria bacterium GW2011_GWA2_38_24 TaxID=1618422 RepID=A0A0G0MPV1_9BACT|nr:MAG: hypothetical protein US86_C0002G0083 [Candidatus Daviesbacteria bacterium GW2011_GWA2_38_24]KKQ79824.1 MAG: hypothetical protein UT01_C0027G0009 [Candidatus Daviesbacteria bacterium GW2011_GWA1_38_7]